MTSNHEVTVYYMELKALGAMLMATDPWPTSSVERDRVVHLANRAAQVFGYQDWVAAYHDDTQPSDTKPPVIKTQTDINLQHQIDVLLYELANDNPTAPPGILQTKIADLTRQVSDLSTKVSGLVDVQITNAYDRLAGHDAKLAGLDRRIATIAINHTDDSAKSQAATLKVAQSLDATTTRLDAKIDTVNTDLLEISNNAIYDHQRLHSRIDESNNTLDTLSAGLVHLSTRIDELETLTRTVADCVSSPSQAKLDRFMDRFGVPK